jgi:hypothetical protein
MTEAGLSVCLEEQMVDVDQNHKKVPAKRRKIGISPVCRIAPASQALPVSELCQ